MNSVTTPGQMWDQRASTYSMILREWKGDISFETVTEVMSGQYLLRSTLQGELKRVTSEEPESFAGVAQQGREIQTSSVSGRERRPLPWPTACSSTQLAETCKTARCQRDCLLESTVLGQTTPPALPASPP